LTLWEIMAHFMMFELALLLKSVAEVETKTGLPRLVNRGHIKPEKYDLFRVRGTLLRLRDLCQQAGFSDAARKAYGAYASLDDRDLDASTASAELKHVYDAVVHDLGRFSFVSIPPELRDYQGAIQFKDAIARFPNDALQDMVCAGDCLAAGQPTASVFHLMRVAEWGLRSVAKDLKVFRVRKNKKFVPIEWATWEGYLRALRPASKARIEGMRPGPKQQSAQEYYGAVLDEIDNLRETFRNHVMHTRRMYRTDETKVIFGRVTRLMNRIATKSF
jgi:hypothetical protein